ncbi:unnamed protein product [Effrenium voratum]|uniref:Secreted protein n=1 Tax=Effrenium voratum TaxID=2562239 RepID=A0AA36N936_9DINO|nr:unnamed protein product [Effrenium voratum]CAJ1403580.1 unnamed protein product [Effrenium voratum]
MAGPPRELVLAQAAMALALVILLRLSGLPYEPDRLLRPWFGVALRCCENFLRQICAVLNGRCRDQIRFDCSALATCAGTLWNHWSGAHARVLAAGQMPSALRSAMLSCSFCVLGLPWARIQAGECVGTGVLWIMTKTLIVFAVVG